MARCSYPPRCSGRRGPRLSRGRLCCGRPCCGRPCRSRRRPTFRRRGPGRLGRRRRPGRPGRWPGRRRRGSGRSGRSRRRGGCRRASRASTRSRRTSSRSRRRGRRCFPQPRSPAAAMWTVTRRPLGTTTTTTTPSNARRPCYPRARRRPLGPPVKVLPEPGPNLRVHDVRRQGHDLRRAGGGGTRGGEQQPVELVG